MRRQLQLDPNNVDALLCLSWEYVINDLPKARRYAEQALALAPQDPDCHRTLARVLREVDYPSDGSRRTVPDPAKGLEHLSHAIEIAPKSPSGYVARAQFTVVQKTMIALWLT